MWRRLFGGAGALQPDAAAHAGAGERHAGQFRDLLCADAFALLKTRHFLIFSLCAMLISVPLGTYYAYTASYLADAGVADVSTAMSFGQMSEIVFMLVIPLLFRRLGVKYMLLIGMVAWFVLRLRPGVSEEGASCSISAFCCTACATTSSLSSALSTPTAWRARR
jgi:Na+/melibiose symporter-like transporter